MWARLLLGLTILFGFAGPAAAYAPPPATSFFIFGPRFTIELPPRVIMNPDQFRYNGQNYTINGTSVTPNNGIVQVELVDRLPGGQDDYYVIKIRNVRKDPIATVRDLRLTFKKPVTKATVDSFESYLRGTSLPNAYLSDSNCGTGGAQSHICLVSKTTLRVPENRNLAPIYLKQTLPIKTIVVGGNVAGQVLQNFIIDGDAIAVGDSVNIGGGTNVQNYFSNSQLRWGNGTDDGLFGQKMEELYAKRTRGSTVNDTVIGKKDNHGAFPGNTGDSVCRNTPQWNLNSTDARNACSSQVSSLSSPPEGKLWNIQNASGTFEIGTGNPNDTVTFSGAGTLVFGGDVIITSKIQCAPGTRLGIMTRGQISIRTNAIACGALITLNGSISFDNAATGDVTGIYVARQNVVLPKAELLQDPYNIRYDAKFATNPTILFREILQLVRDNLS